MRTKDEDHRRVRDNVRCPSCNAPAGTWCTGFQTLGLHTSRIELAKEQKVIS